MIKSIEYVCSGNIARSKIAEAFTKKFANDSGLELKVVSSGINTNSYESGEYSDEVASKLREITPSFPGYQKGMGLWQIYRLLSTYDAFFRDKILSEYGLQVDPSLRQTIVMPDVDLILAFDQKIKLAVDDIYAQSEIKPNITTIWAKAGTNEYSKGSFEHIIYDENLKPCFDLYRDFSNLITDATRKIVEGVKDEKY